MPRPTLLPMHLRHVGPRGRFAPRPALRPVGKPTRLGTSPARSRTVE